MIKIFLTNGWRWVITKSPKWLVNAIGAIFISVVTAVIVDNYNKARPKVEASYAVIDTTPYRKDALGQLTLKYKSDRQINRFQLSVASIGSESVKQLYVDVRATKANLFSSSKILFDPPLLENRVSKRSQSGERIYLEMPELPINTSIFVDIGSLDHFEEKEVDVDILGSGQRWEALKQPISLRSRRSSWNENSVNSAYGQESPLKETPTAPKAEKFPKGGIYIGGYDPIALSNEILVILQNRKIVERAEAEKIKKATEELKSGVTFGGVDVLKFDEEVLNALLRKRIIDRTEAEAILDRSRKAGGVLINGYNVIRLKAEILNVLVVKNLVSLTEAQAALDKAKAPEQEPK